MMFGRKEQDDKIERLEARLKEVEQTIALELAKADEGNWISADEFNALPFKARHALESGGLLVRRESGRVLTYEQHSKEIYWGHLSPSARNYFNIEAYYVGQAND